MRQPERPFYTDHQAPHDKARRQFKHPFRSLATDMLPDKEDQRTFFEPSAQPFQKTGLPPYLLCDSHSYEELDKNLPSNLFDVTSMSNMRLMQISGAMRAIRLVPYAPEEPISVSPSTDEWPLAEESHYTLPAAFSPSASQIEPISDSLPPLSLSQISITTAQTAPMQEVPETKKQLYWQSQTLKIVLMLLLGIGMLALVVRFVNMPLTFKILQRNLETPRGIFFACLSGLALASSYCIRGARWRLFLKPIGKVSLLQAIQLFWIAVFINFILPVQGGELAKSLMLKRISNIPVSQSLPTVAMDKALDLLPALFIMALVPFIPGIHMSPTLWIILSFVGSILIGLIFAVFLMALSRKWATSLICSTLGFLPKGLAEKIESFAFGFIDSLLAGASRPKIFLPAVLLTLIAVGCDGLFALFSFWAVGVSTMTFWIAIFGYAVYSMFYILPTPPGHIGSNEFAGFIVFSELLGYKQSDVTAMFIFSHPLGAVIMGLACILCLSGLNLSFSNAISLKQTQR